MNGNIINVEVKMIGIDLPLPFPLAFGTLSTLPRVFLILHVFKDGSIIKCIGEASIDFPFSHYDAWDIYSSLKDLQLEGSNVNDRVHLLQENRYLLMKFPAAFAALNMALDDAYGQVNRLSILELYGEVRKSGKALESISMPTDTSELQLSYNKVVKKGHLVKLKGGRGIGKDAEFISTILKSTKETKFAVDFNAAYKLDEFVQLAKMLSRYNVRPDRIMFFEQPTTTNEGLKSLVEASLALNKYAIPVQIVADEGFITASDAMFCHMNGILLNFKIQKIGGIEVSKEIETSLGAAAFHSMVGGTFPTAIGRAWDRCAVCVLSTATLPSDGWEPSTDWFDGDLHLIKERFGSRTFFGNGLGITVRWDLMQKFIVKNPKEEYRLIRNNKSGKRIKIQLNKGVSYSALYEQLNNKRYDWNLSA